MTEKKFKVRFTRNTGSNESQEPHLKGEEMTLPETSYHRWLRRGAVELVAEESKPIKTAAGKKTATKETK